MSEENTIEQEIAVEVPRQENTFTQEQMNAIVGREKNAAAERARRESEEKYKLELESVKKQNSGSVDMDSIVNQVKAQMVGELKAAKERAEQEKIEAEYNRQANQYINHMKDVKVSDPDEEDPSRLLSEPVKYTPFCLTVGEMNLDNTAEVMREMAKRPDLVISANQAAKDGNDSAAKAIIRKFAKSIQSNKEAAQSYQKVNAPLSQLKSSSVGSGVDISKMSIKDLRSQSWLRG